MERFDFWQKWLCGVSIVVIFFGIFMAFFSGTILFKVMDENVNMAFWGEQEVSNEIKNFQRWVYGAWGATIAGWGVFIFYITRYPFKNKESWAWNAMLFGVLVWYLVDTGFSLYFQVHVNVLLNTFLLILGLLPLFFTRKDFARNTSRNLSDLAKNEVHDQA